MTRASPASHEVSNILSSIENTCSTNHVSLTSTPTGSSGRITPRKPLRPLKSASKSDPSCKGVVFKVRSGIKGSDETEEATPQIIIDTLSSSTKKTKPERRSTAKSKKRKLHKSPVRLFSSSSTCRSPDYSLNSEGSRSPISGSSASCDDDDDTDFGLMPIQVEKECASCGTGKTPLWRDAEDGTHLCNACGIRWKKYHVRCIQCWYIPRKDEKGFPKCLGCGTDNSIRFIIPVVSKKPSK